MRGPSLRFTTYTHMRNSQKQPSTSIASGSAGAPDLLLRGICPFRRYRGTVQYISCATLTACTCTEQTDDTDEQRTCAVLAGRLSKDMTSSSTSPCIDMYCSSGCKRCLQPQPNHSSFHARQPGGDELRMEMSGRLPSDIFVRIPPQPFDLILPATTSTKLPSVEDTLNDVSRLRAQFPRVSSVRLQRPHFNW